MSREALRARRQVLATGLAAAMFAASGLPVAAGIRRGGALRAGLGGASAADGWDGARHDGLFMQAVASGAVFETLTEIAADGTLRGELAVGWEPREEARVWLVTLRDGVAFHDGRPLGARDVAASLVALGGAGPAAQIVEAAAVGPRRVRIVLAAPNPHFPYELSDPRMIVHPEGAHASGVGTGPYRVAAFEPGRRFLGRRVEAHWKDGRAGWFDSVEVFALDPAAVRLSALRSGRVDAIGGVELHAVGMLRARGLTVQEAGGWVQAVSDRVGVPGRVGAARPMDDLRFMQRWWAA